MNNTNGFIKANGKRIVNGLGEELLLRGVGFGSWMLPEGYMWHFPQQGDRPRRVEKMVTELVGNKKAEEFWSIYRENYITEIDIQKVAQEGFNSVRLPINSRNILESSEPVRLNETVMKYIDQVISWCREYELYVIWDLHGAPGGQTGTNIDDSENNRPELFIDDKNHKITVELWKLLAERYKNEWIIAGYDLLNEPLPNWNSAYNHKVIPLYKDIIKSIREVDKNHMIILEGVHWATDWSIFTEAVDDNIMLQFHKYWNNPDTESIQAYLAKRDELNVPIFMGEGGENNIYWYTGAFRLFEDHDISWNFWTWKKMNTTNSPYSVKMPDGWSLLVSYLEGGEKPDKELSEKILWEYLDNLQLERCDYHPEVARSLFRRAPVRIPAIFYGYGGKETGFHVSKPSSLNAGFRIKDEVSFSFMEGSRQTVNFQHVQGQPWALDEWLCAHINPGDWFAYDFTAASSSETDTFSISLCVSAPNGTAKLPLSIDGMAAGTLEAAGTSWATVTLDKKLSLSHGSHRIIVKAEENPVLMKWLDIKEDASL